jgi:hypothetical protein
MPPNADPERSKANWWDKSSAEVMQRYDALLPEKIRKNAVHAVEFVVSLSPEDCGRLGPDKLARYLTDATAWCQARLGGRKNTICAAVHLDELTPHLHLVMMPIKDGKLNARAFIGGHRDVLKEMQTNFAAEVGAKYGLDRGLPREQTKRRHIAVREYYAKVDQEILKKRQREAALQTAAQEKRRKGRER